MVSRADLRVVKLGLPHLAHLRAVALGISPVIAAVQYLPIESRQKALAAHHAVVDRARALGREAKLKDWRLIGLTIRAGDVGEGAPSIDVWAARNGYEDWSESELLATYREVFPADRKQVRNARLRERHIAAVAQLEKERVSRARESDRLELWFDRSTAHRFEAIGLLTLGDLKTRMGRNTRWWSGLRAIGRIKALRIAGFVGSLFPEYDDSPENLLSGDGSGGVRVWQKALAATLVQAGAGRTAAPADSMLSAQTDGEAIEAWIAARTNSVKTALSYRKELRRLYLWSVTVRGKTLSQLTVEDCSAYKHFLSDIPDDWMGAKSSITDRAHWVPFAKQLSAASQRQALVIVNGFFVWAVATGYVNRNPWAATTLRVSATQEEATALLSSRAFTKKAWEQIVKHFANGEGEGEGAEDRADNRYGSRDVAGGEKGESRRAQMRLAARARFEFIVGFCESTGLRSAELLAARIEHFKRVDEGLFLSVVGKGGAARIVVVPAQAERALERYLRYRGLGSLDAVLRERAKAKVLLVPNLITDGAQVSYTAFYMSVKRGLKQAIQRSTLNGVEKSDALRASPHWLRHTFGTRAIERGVTKSVLMAQFGHADERPTSRYSRAQREQMNAEIGKAFG
jgi:site-specific recombinase XerD